MLRFVIPEAPFVLSIAGLSASFAGLAGLVMALRRGGEVRAIDTLRLRQMVEFSFSNILIAVSVIPLAQLLGSTSAAAVWISAGIIVYTLLINVTLARRTRGLGIRFGGWWAAAALSVGFVAVVLGAIVVVNPRVELFELLLVVMLARPMLPFLLVLSSWADETRSEAGASRTS